MTSNPSSASPLETLDLNSQYKERYTVGATWANPRTPLPLRLCDGSIDGPQSRSFRLGILGGCRWAHHIRTSFRM